MKTLELGTKSPLELLEATAQELRPGTPGQLLGDLALRTGLWMLCITDSKVLWTATQPPRDLSEHKAYLFPDSKREDLARLTKEDGHTQRKYWLIPRTLVEVLKEMK